MIQRTLIIMLSLILASSQGLTDANKKKKNLEQEKKNTEAMISDLNSLKSDVNKYVTKLDEDLAQLESEIEDLNGKISEVEAEIDIKEREIDQMSETEKDQYSDMKLRIKYMYERPATNFLDMLLETDSLVELLNKSEYVTKISKYDREKLDEYEATEKKLEEKKTELEDRRQELEDLKTETEEKQDGVEKLLSEKRSEIQKYENQIDAAEVKLDEYEKEIKKQEDTIKAIEAEIKRKEEEARKAAEAAGKAYKTVNLGDIHFIWPCPSSSRVTSYFGDREQPVAGASTDHKGIDIGASKGSGILAAADGEVIISTYSPSAGNYIMINHGGGVYTVYMHCSELLVSSGEMVKQGAIIGKVGSTGYSTGPHLHFGIRANGNYINPLAYVSP